MLEKVIENWTSRLDYIRASRGSPMPETIFKIRPVEVDDDLIKAIIDSDRHSTTREIAEKLHISHTCIENHLKQLGYVQKLDTWVPHELNETHLTQHINSCDLLKIRNENDPFLKRLITGDEKWVVHNNIKRKRPWSRPGEPTQTTSKVDIHQKKILLSVWWDYKGIIYFELLTPNRTINSDVYIEQLTKLNNAVEEKRPELTNRKGVVFHHDNGGHTHLWSLGKNYWNLVGMFCHIHHIVLTLHHLINFCFDLYKTP
ncbi:mariner Mos1 transposase [Trichonephila clavipes]|nr:mariner Mos1 transposase [Trichonephila clavipes]